jgi:tetratricopeptide (TPR) repeat protein
MIHSYSLKSIAKHLCIATLLVLSTNFALAQDDRIITTKGGAAVKGKITKRTRDEVVIQVRGNDQSFPTNEILRVVNDGEPKPLTMAKDLITTGQLDQAIEEFKKIAPASLPAGEIKQDYEFYKGLLAANNALRGRGDATVAAKLLTEWVKANPTSNMYYSAAEKLGELALALGNNEQAAKSFNAVAGAPFPDLKVRGNYLTGKALLAQKQTANAKAKFESVVQAQVSDAVSLKFKKLASVAMVRCDAADGKLDQAMQTLDKMVDEGDSTDAELFAELYNATGSILQAAGNHDEALLAYLKTDLLYASQADAHAEALFALAQLWPKVGDVQRGTDAKSRLGKLYPTSPWLKK